MHMNPIHQPKGLGGDMAGQRFQFSRNCPKDMGYATLTYLQGRDLSTVSSKGREDLAPKATPICELASGIVKASGIQGHKNVSPPYHHPKF